MRRITILIILVLSVLPKVLAQESLDISPFFSHDFFEKNGVTTLTVKGEKLKDTGISTYRSITVTGNDEGSDQLAQAVKHDGAKALTREVSYRDGKLYFGFYVLKPHASLNRYILYLDRTEGEERKTTLIYLEGTADTQKIKKFLNKKDV